MRERLDCALLAPGRGDWVNALQGAHLGGRLHLHALQPQRSSAQALMDDSALVRGRYDAGLLYADEASLSVWRTILAARAGRLPAVLLVYAVGLRAQAVHDLISLGVADFVRPPFCPEELRARLQAALQRLIPVRLAEPLPDYGQTNVGLHHQPLTETDLCDTILDRSGAELEAYAVALAMQRATTQDSFRDAKNQVVARFERAYIRAALGRHGGNITLAARMAQKHRRAFWTLMRKHDIDPTPYRVDVEDPSSPKAGKIWGSPP
ncbi:helix-turn-helix domain-containing protein [Castellaniella sp.]|uniref:helix-turn-helix domain-containing protein n=1 Tax=Castellaniella sp. TaxID=1955812 RepID=UPI002AFE0879|nr:helix-turn-helix domain-containing protein [Castellaniella sp.]